MGDRNEVTATSFRVTVSAAEPYSFQACATQQVQSSVRITHITFTPPSAEEAEAYMQHQQKLAGTAAAPSGDKKSRNKDNDNTSVAVRPATLASLRTLCASGKMESHLVACFPWTVTGDAAAEAGKHKRGAGDSSSSVAAAAHPVEHVQLAGFFDVALPQVTDICSNVDLRFDVDGSVWLEVDGPGSVTFFGEQFSSLIPEWLSHDFYTVDSDDEEGDGEDDDEDDDDDDDVDGNEIAAMHRLFR